MKRKTIWKRCVVILSIVLLIGVVSYTIFNCVSAFADSSLKREIAYEIQKIKDKGEPSTIGELIPEDISDGENGALLYRQIFDLTKKEEKKQVNDMASTLCMKPLSEWSEKEKVEASSAIQKNKDIYDLLGKVSMMKCQFLKRKDCEKGAGILLPHLRYLRNCSRLLAIKAKMEAENGEIDKSLKSCLTGLKVAKAVSTESILICQLVRNALDHITLSTLEDVLTKREGSIDRYQSLIDEVRKEREDRIIYFSLLGERIVFGMQEFPRLQREMAEKWMKMGEEERSKAFEEMLGKEQPTKDLEEAFLKTPETFFDNQELYYLKMMAKAISLAEMPYWEARGKVPAFNKEIQDLPKEKAILTQMLLPALSRAYNQEARLDALLGDAEIALACYIYEAKHGEFPSSLKELTPGILPTLPLDPFTGNNYIYRKERKGFVVYSVGDNLKDDGGKWGKPNRYTGDFDIVFCGFGR